MAAEGFGLHGSWVMEELALARTTATHWDWLVRKMVCAEADLHRDTSIGQTSETKAEEPLVNQQMRTAFSGGSVYGR